jgi:hypothetical protein
MSKTVIYKGWISAQPPRKKRNGTIIVVPSRFLYNPKKHVIAEKIAEDKAKYGPYVNIRIWAYYRKIKPILEHLVLSKMGEIDAEYSEITSANDDYKYTRQYINVDDDVDLLKELARLYHHYCIIEITYSATEYDMITHELERVLLLNYD